MSLMLPNFNLSVLVYIININNYCVVGNNVIELLKIDVLLCKCYIFSYSINMAIKTSKSHYEDKLNATGENELITKSAKKEVNLKKLIAELKIDNATIYNYYLIYLNILGNS